MNSGIFEPSDLADMREVFEEITSQPWFSRAPDARKAFARYLIEAYPGGTLNPATDKPLLEATARSYYSRDGY
nr:hypothetical protein [uncultured Shinella sp.]